MLNLFELAAKITLDKKDFESGLKSSESMMSKFSSGFNKTLKIAAASTGAAAAAGAAAFAKMAKSALDAEGELEQNLGGAVAVFGEKWNEYVKENAIDAAYSMGVSMNDYLSAANKMGSLLQGVGFSELDAADKTVEVMQRAADVASIMGIDVTAALDAVTGAAKGNFTMMDNLGVAVNDTSLKMYAASKGWKKAAIDNMTTQEKVALAFELFLEKTEKYEGNYIKENKTLAGALTTLKAQWQNFISGAGETFGTSDVVADNLAEFASDAADIVVKKLGDIVPRLTSGLRIVMKTLGPKLPKLMETLMPGVEEGVGAMLDLLGDALPYLLQTAVNLVPSVVSGIGKLFVKVGQKAPEMLKGLWNGIKNAGEQLGGLVFGRDAKGAIKWPTWDDVKGYAVNAWNGIKNGAKKIADFAGGLIFGRKEDGTVDWPTWKEVGQKAGEIWEAIKTEAAKLTGLVFGDDSGIKSFKELLESIKTKWNELKTTIKENAIDFLSGFTGKSPEEIEPILDGIAEGLTAIGVAIAIYQLGTTLTTVFNAITGFFASGLTVQHPVLLAISALAAAGVLIYENWDGISEFFSNLWQGITEWATSAYEAVKKWWEEDIVTPIKEKWDAIVAAVENVVESVKLAWSIIVDWFTESIIDPIKAKWEAITSKVQEIVAACQAAWLLIVTWFTENIITPISSTWDAIVTKIKDVVEDVKSAWNIIVAWFTENIIDPIKSTWDEITSKVSEVVSVIESTFEAIVSWFDEHIIQPIKSAWDAIINPIKEWLGIEDHKSIVIDVKQNGINKVMSSDKPLNERAQELADVMGFSLDDYYASLGKEGDNAKGLGYVPYDGYRSILHRGEMILNKSRADDYRKGNGRISIAAMTQAITAAVRAGMNGVNYNFSLDGEKVAQNTSSRQAEDDMAWRFAVG